MHKKNNIRPIRNVAWVEDSKFDPLIALYQYAVLCVFDDNPDSFNYHMKRVRLNWNLLNRYFNLRKCKATGVAEAEDADLQIGWFAEPQSIAVVECDLSTPNGPLKSKESAPAGSNVKLICSNGFIVLRLTGVNQSEITFATHWQILPDITGFKAIESNQIPLSPLLLPAPAGPSNSSPIVQNKNKNKNKSPALTPKNSPKNPNSPIKPTSPPPPSPNPPPPPPPPGPQANPPGVNPPGANVIIIPQNITFIWVFRVIWELLKLLFSSLFEWLVLSKPPMPVNYFIDPQGNPDPGPYNRYVAALLNPDFKVPDLLRTFSQQQRRGPDLYTTICEDVDRARQLQAYTERIEFWADLNQYLRETWYVYFQYFVLITTTLIFQPFLNKVLQPVTKLLINLAYFICRIYFHSLVKLMYGSVITIYGQGSWLTQLFDSIHIFFNPMDGEWKHQFFWDVEIDPHSNGRYTFGPDICIQVQYIVLLESFIFYCIFVPLLEETVKQCISLYFYTVPKYLNLKKQRDQWSRLQNADPDATWYGSRLWGSVFFIVIETALYGPSGAIMMHFLTAYVSFKKAVLAHALWNAFVYIANFQFFSGHLCWNWLFDDAVNIQLSRFFRYGFLPLYVSFAVLLWLILRRIKRNPEDHLDVDFQEYFQLVRPKSVHMLPICVGDRPVTVDLGNSVTLATGGHKKTYRGYFSCGLMLRCAVPFSFAGCHHNCNGAATSRMAGPKKRYQGVNDQVKVANFWRNVVIRQTNRPTIHSVEGEITRQKWLSKFTMMQGEHLLREYESGNRSTVFDMFIKKEKSVRLNPRFQRYQAYGAVIVRDGCVQTILHLNGEKFDPRGISVPRADIRVQFGPSSHRLQNYLKSQYGDHILFACGLTRRQFSKWYDERLVLNSVSYCNLGDDLMQINGGEDPTLESLDISRFDMHVIDAALEYNARVYSLLNWNEEAIYSLATINKVYKIRPGVNGGKGVIKVKGTQASGKWDTLGGNSLIVLRLIEFAEERRLPLRRALHLGGFVPTGGSAPAYQLEVDFLQNLAYPTKDDGTRFGPKIGRILSRSFWSDTPLSHEKHLPYCYGVLLGLANDIMHIPILNDLFLRLSELSFKPWYPKKINRSAFLVSETPAKECPSTLGLLADRYQVPLEQLKRYRQYVRNWTPGTWLDEGFEFLVYAIVEKDTM